MTELYIIRHGIAADREKYHQDFQRPLTDIGQQKTHKVAQKLIDMNYHFDLILTSPLLRARQTADILKKVGLSHHLEESLYLSPGGDIHSWLNWLENWQKNNHNSLAIVGHEPDLSHWAEMLIWGEIKNKIVLKKAGIIGLTLPEKISPIGNSLLFWLTSPKLLLEN